MNTPIIILIILFAVSLLLSANQHGKPKEGKHNFWASLIGAIIQGGLTYWIIIS